MKLYKTRESVLEPSAQFVYGELKDRSDLASEHIQLTRFILVDNGIESYLIREGVVIFESEDFFVNQCGALPIEFAVEKELEVKEITE